MKFPEILLIFSLCCLFASYIIIGVIETNNKQAEWIDYDVVIQNDHDVILYNINDTTDSICLRLENSYALADEWMIQVKH